MAKKAAQRKNTHEPQVLHLTLHREYFDAIAAAKKKTEYLDNFAHWRSRLLGRTYSEVHFRNGYAVNAPFMRVECLGHGKDRPNRFAIRLGKVLETKNYRPR
jgi:hypothetical protein